MLTGKTGPFSRHIGPRIDANDLLEAVLGIILSEQCEEVIELSRLEECYRFGTSQKLGPYPLASTISPFVLSTIARNSPRSASGT